MNPSISTLSRESLELLRDLIRIPSFSKEEGETAACIRAFLGDRQLEPQTHLHNVWVRNTHFHPERPTLLLNSHHDTVKPNKGYTRDPFSPDVIDGKLFGLGSNDAGGCLVALLAAFRYFYQHPNLRYNLLFAATAEEENSGPHGVESLLPLLGPIDCGIVGEPTRMDLAIAERGLMVLDGFAEGIAGHAARQEGESALYKALDDVQILRSISFPRVSEWLGPVQVSVTVMQTDNTQHNVVPATCRFVVDVRVNEHHSFEEVLEILREKVQSTLTPRSCRLRSTAISPEHPLVLAGLALGKKPYGSPTTSDKALMPFPTLKMGPGDSARSHTADEFLYVSELEQGILDYIALLHPVLTGQPFQHL